MSNEFSNVEEEKYEYGFLCEFNLFQFLLSLIKFILYFEFFPSWTRVVMP